MVPRAPVRNACSANGRSSAETLRRDRARARAGGTGARVQRQPVCTTPVQRVVRQLISGRSRSRHSHSCGQRTDQRVVRTFSDTPRGKSGSGRCRIISTVIVGLAGISFAAAVVALLVEALVVFFARPALGDASFARHGLEAGGARAERPEARRRVGGRCRSGARPVVAAAAAATASASAVVRRVRGRGGRRWCGRRNEGGVHPEWRGGRGELVEARAVLVVSLGR